MTESEHNVLEWETGEQMGIRDEDVNNEVPDEEEFGWICSEVTSHNPSLNQSESEALLSSYHLSPFVFRVPKWMKTRCPKREQPPCLPMSLKLRVSPKQHQPDEVFQGRHLPKTTKTTTTTATATVQSSCLAITNEVNILGTKEKGSSPWMDEDGDLDVPRGNDTTNWKLKPPPLEHIKRDLEVGQKTSTTPSEQKQDHPDEDEENKEQIWLEYKTHTRLNGVGAQVWRGSLFLADFLLNYPEQLRGKRVLEIGAGAGLASVVALLCQPQGLVATDLAFNLDLLERNLARNVSCLSGMLSNLAQTEDPDEIYQVMPCDIKTITSEKESAANAETQTGSATMVERVLTARQVTCSMDVYLGADLVYDQALSKALVDFIRHIACSLLREPSSKVQTRVVLLSIDKRYIFTLKDAEIKAPMFEHFYKELREMLGHLPPRIKAVLREFDMNDVTQFFRYQTSSDLIILEIIFSV